MASSAAATKPSKYDVRRDTVLDAAAAVFAELGYHGASTGLIAERVGIRQGSLYYYFSSKEEALSEVCLKGIGDLLTGLDTIAKTAAPSENKLHAAILNHLRPAIERPNYVRAFIAQRQFLPDASRKSVGRQVRQYERVLTDVIRQGVASRAFRTDLDCELAALGLIGECNAVFAWYGKRVRGQTIERIADAIAARFLRGVQA
jgi:AcrR family transcriptional regulator